jgi:hypothetical protein
MAYATEADLLEIEPTILDYGVLDFDAELAKSETEVNRILTVRWWPVYMKDRRYDIVRRVGEILMDTDKLDPTQWTQATVYHALAHHICPKLSTFDPARDVFREKMEYYGRRFESEMDLCIREGVRYDDNDDDIFQDVEKLPDVSLRLRR